MAAVPVPFLFVFLMIAVLFLVALDVLACPAAGVVARPSPYVSSDDVVLRAFFPPCFFSFMVPCYLTSRIAKPLFSSCTRACFHMFKKALGLDFG